MIGDPCKLCAVGHSLGGEQDLCDHCNQPPGPVRAIVRETGEKVTLIPPGTVIRCDNADEPDKTAQNGAQPPALLSSTQVAPGTPTTTILNTEGNAIAWDLIETESRRIGIVAAAAQLKVNAQTVRSRCRDHKWKGIPDGRTLAARKKLAVTNSGDQPGDFSNRIIAHREKVFKTASDSLGKKKTIPIRNAKDFDIVDRIARRAAGIDDTDPRNTAVLIHINEAIDAHGDDQPIEAEVVSESSPASLPPSTPDSLGQQGCKEP